MKRLYIAHAGDLDEVRAHITRIADELDLEGLTLSSALGFERGGQWEPTVVLETTAPTDSVAELARRVGRALGQERVLVHWGQGATLVATQPV